MSDIFKGWLIEEFLRWDEFKLHHVKEEDIYYLKLITYDGGGTYTGSGPTPEEAFEKATKGLELI